ncbi:hypothetical protein MBLNU13_g00680t1 [Cladosporium sp. NU13]
MSGSPPSLLFQEGFQDYYNSIEFSDVKTMFKVDVRDYRGNFGYVEEQVVYARRVVLAAGSRAFRDYFETHTQVGTTDYTVLASDICSVPDEVFLAVLRHLYGVPSSPEDEDKDVIPAMDWRKLCGVVNQFGIPSLLQDVYKNHKDSEATELIAKLAWKNIANLRKHEAFNELTDKCPELLRAVLATMLLVREC